MTGYFYEDHLNWLQEQSKATEAKLDAVRQKKEEAEASAAQVKQMIAYVKNLMARAEEYSCDESNGNYQTNGHTQAYPSPKDDDDCFEDLDIPEPHQPGETRVRSLDNAPPDKEPSSDNPPRRTPKQMLRPEYSNGSIAAAIAAVLGRNEELNQQELFGELFDDVRDDDEVKRAKSSLAAELNRGIKEGKIERKGRGLFGLAEQRRYTQQELQALSSAN